MSVNLDFNLIYSSTTTLGGLQLTKTNPPTPQKQRGLTQKRLVHDMQKGILVDLESGCILNMDEMEEQTHHGCQGPKM